MAVAGMGGGHGGECGVRGPGIARRSNLHASKITSCMRRIICQSRNLAGPSLAAALAPTWAAANWPPANLCRTVTGGARRGVQEAAEKSTPERFFSRALLCHLIGATEKALSPATGCRQGRDAAG